MFALAWILFMLEAQREYQNYLCPVCRYLCDCYLLIYYSADIANGSITVLKAKVSRTFVHQGSGLTEIYSSVAQVTKLTVHYKLYQQFPVNQQRLIHHQQVCVVMPETERMLATEWLVGSSS